MLSFLGGWGAHISNLRVGERFKTHLGRKRRIETAFQASPSSNNNKKPPSSSRAAPVSAAVFLTKISLTQARNLKRKHDLRRKWCMLTKRDLSHMDRNKRKIILIATQPPLVCRPLGRKEKSQNEGSEARAMEDGARRTFVSYEILVNSSQ